MGRSGSGKTTVAEKLKEMYDWNQIYSYTTRKPRYENEPGHIFTTENDYFKAQDLVAHTFFNNAHYWATAQQVEENQVYVIDPAGYDVFKDAYKGTKLVVPFILECSDKTCFNRMIARGDSLEKASSRLIHDEQRFSNLQNINAITLDSDNFTPEELAETIHWIINKAIINNNL